MLYLRANVLKMFLFVFKSTNNGPKEAKRCKKMMWGLRCNGSLLHRLLSLRPGQQRSTIYFTNSRDDLGKGNVGAQMQHALHVMTNILVAVLIIACDLLAVMLNGIS